MAVVAGIDEAGYGPRLGPLVVSAVAFEVADAAAGLDLWGLLGDAVSRSVRDRDRVPVDDSKRLFSQAIGLRHIERTALAFAAAAGIQPATFRGLLAGLAELDEPPDSDPWYAGFDLPVPLDAQPDRIAADARRLLAVRRTADFLGVRSMPVLEGEFNRLVESVGTKSATLFLATSRLLTHLWTQWGERGLIVHVDKHGGRDRYGLLLHQTFFGARIHVVREGHHESVYEVSDGGRRMTIGFYEGGDSRHLPVALASCYSKYVRELFMRGFNAYWLGHVPGLQPTAGYCPDADRFLRDIEPVRRSLGIPDRRLVRMA